MFKTCSHIVDRSPPSEPLPCIATKSGASTLEIPASPREPSFSMTSLTPLKEVNGHTVPFCLISHLPDIRHSSCHCLQPRLFSRWLSLQGTVQTQRLRSDPL